MTPASGIYTGGLAGGLSILCHKCVTYIIVVVVGVVLLLIILIATFQGLGLVACSKSEFLFSETYDSIGQLVVILGQGTVPTQGLYLHTEHNREKHKHTSMPQVGFETMIPVFEWPKTVHASDCLATGTGN
jgi:hypothetical protein